jgi:hypothetical protein
MRSHNMILESVSSDVRLNILDSQKFHLEEYDARRDEIIHHGEVNAALEREALIGSVAIYAWGLTQSHSVSDLSVICLSLIFFLPCILTHA